MDNYWTLAYDTVVIVNSSNIYNLSMYSTYVETAMLSSRICPFNLVNILTQNTGVFFTGPPLKMIKCQITL